MTSPWDLLQSGHYEAAVKEYSRLCAEEGGTFYLFNRGIAYLLLGNFDAAQNDFRQIIDEEPTRPSAAAFCFVGIAQWHLNQPQEAITTWRAGLNARYSDAAGGVEIPVLLLYAGWRMGHPAVEAEALSLLQTLWGQHCRRHKRVNRGTNTSTDDFVHPGLLTWPGPLAPLYLGEIDSSMVQKVVDQTSPPTLQERYQCAVNFHLGLVAGRQGDRDAFQRGMRRCAASRRGLLEAEFYLARWEVDRGFLPLSVT
ncbi:MAG: tetratricopeptide repeat protein [Gemmataceae bacterium]